MNESGPHPYTSFKVFLMLQGSACISRVRTREYREADLLAHLRRREFRPLRLREVSNARAVQGIPATLTLYARNFFGAKTQP